MLMCSGLRPLWINALAELHTAGPGEQRLRRVNTRPAAPRAQQNPENILPAEALMEPTPGAQRGRVNNMAISVTDEIQQAETQARAQARLEGVGTRRVQSGNVPASSTDRGRDRDRERERQENLARERSLRRRLEREAGYNISPRRDSRAAPGAWNRRLSSSTRPLPPRNPRAAPQAGPRRTASATRPPPRTGSTNERVSRARGSSPRPRPVRGPDNTSKDARIPDVEDIESDTEGEVMFQHDDNIDYGEYYMDYSEY